MLNGQHDAVFLVGRRSATGTRGLEAACITRVLDGAVRVDGGVDGKRDDIFLRKVSFPHPLLSTEHFASRSAS